MTSKHNYKSFLSCLIIVLFVSNLTGAFNGNSTAPKAVDGVIDLRSWDFKNDGSLELIGNWNFYYQRFIDPVLFRNKKPDVDGLIAVPGTWNDFEYDKRAIGSYGYGTYHVKILLPESETDLALSLNTISTAAVIFANENELGHAGKPGFSRSESLPDYYPLVSDLPTDSSVIDLVIHVSNYHHTNGGLWTNIIIGSEIKIRRESELRLLINIFIAGSLILLGLYQLSMVRLYGYTRSPLYFGLFSFLIGIRALSTGDVNLHHFFHNFPWWLLIRIEYLTVFFGLPLFIKFQRSVFPKDFPRRVSSIFLAISLVFALLVIITPTWIFTQSLIFFFLVAIPATVACFYFAITSVRKKRVGAKIFLAASLVLFITFINDVLFSLELIYTGYLTAYGLLLFVMIQAFLLSFRFSESFKTIGLQEKELRDHKDNLEHLVADRTVELEEANKRLKAQTMVDGLTQIANRRHFDAHSKIEWSRMRRYKKPLAIILYDIDYFKKFNDNYGHQAGDECLKIVAAELKGSINRPADLVARYGGEEFCAILPDTNLAGAKKIASQTCKNVEGLQLKHEESTASEFVTVSGGVAVQIPDDDNSLKQLIEEADRNLYKAKGAGRNRVASS